MSYIPTGRGDGSRPSITNEKSTDRRPASMEPLKSSSGLRWALAALALTVGPAMAQPTGNPKGTLAPATEGSAGKSPATGNRARQEDGPKGSATNPDSRAARSGNLRTPGIGTAGGLSGRHPGDGSGSGPTPTNQAPPIKK